jgi:Acetyltransferase (GNAT) domain
MGACSAFFRMHPLLSNGLSELFPEGFFTAAGETVAMDLTLDESELWKGIREGHQWTIKKCKKLGFVPRMVSLREFIERVMEIYWETMDRVQAKDSYYFGRDYFAKLGEMPGQVHCWVVESEGQQAAACIFFECGGIVQAHLGGTKSEFLKKSPFHLLLYAAAGWAKSRGNRYLHIGGGVGGSNDRLLQFKRGFSQLLFPFSTLRLITDEGKYRELTTRRAQAADVSVDDFSCGDFFPAYRAPL